MTLVSPEDQQILGALKKAVAETLEQKRRLGQYAVVWRDGRPTILGEGSPVSLVFSPIPTLLEKGKSWVISSPPSWMTTTGNALNDRGGQPCLVPVKQGMLQELLTGRIRLV